MPSRPLMPKGDPDTARLFDTLLPEDPRVTIRPMFGHRAAFVNGNMFAGTFGTSVFVRLEEDARAELLAVSGSRAFEPMAGRPMRDYVVVPPHWLRQQPRARMWVTRAFEYAANLPPKGKSPKRRSKRQGN